MTEQPTRIRTKAEESLAAHFAALAADDPMREVRASAFDAFLEKGLPHRRVEEWKYTDLRALVRDVPAPARPAPSAEARAALERADTFGAIDRARIVFVNGHFVPPLSDLAGLEGALDFASLGRFLADGAAVLDRSFDPAETPITALNAAFVSDGAVLRIPDNAELSRPIEIVNLYAGDTPGLYTLRHQITVGDNAKATILMTSAGPDGVAYVSNVVSELFIGDGAELRLVTAQEEGDEAVHLSLAVPRLAGKVRFEPFVFTAGALVARQEIRLSFEEAGSDVGLRGVTIGGGKQHLDTTLIVDHAAESCGGHEYFKAAMAGESKGVFQGKIVVQPGAQKTDSKMMSRALLLSDAAEFANKPELEIFADDVVCGHGATCGQIDKEMLFFLRSRGIPEAEAERMLVLAFLAEAIELIGDERIVELLEARTARRLTEAKAA